MGDDETASLAELRAHASVAASMAMGMSREAATRAAGLSEEAYEALDRRVDAALDRAIAASTQSPDPVLVTYERELREAQARARAAQPEITVDQLLRALAALGSGDDPRKALESLGLDPAALVRAVTQHAPTLARDPALGARLAQLFAATRSKKP